MDLYNTLPKANLKSLVGLGRGIYRIQGLAFSRKDVQGLELLGVEGARLNLTHEGPQKGIRPAAVELRRKLPN